MVVVALPCCANAWAAHALERRAAAQPAITPGPGSGQSLLFWAQNRKAAKDPDKRSPWPPHLKYNVKNGTKFENLGKRYF